MHVRGDPSILLLYAVVLVLCARQLDDVTVVVDVLRLLALNEFLPELV